jgi:hypothetical protein
LLDIAERRSVPELVAAASSQKITNSTDSVASRLSRDFTEKVEPPWRQFVDALRLGGAFTTTRGTVAGRREFCAPYVYSAFPEDIPNSIGALELPWAIVRSNTPVYAAPSKSAKVVGRLGYALVEFLDYFPPGVVSAGDPGWVHVTVTESRRGFVVGDAARSPEDWHVCLAREPDGWRIVEFSQDRFELKPERGDE